MDAYVPYEPLNVPKPFGENVWIVNGPEIRMDYGPIKLPFPTRMTVVRLADGSLWVHSPIAPDEQMFAAVDALGEVRHIVAPNSIHYWYMVDWLERYPKATSYAVPDLETKAKKRPFRIDHRLKIDTAMPWQDEIDWLLVPGTAITEAVFFVRGAKVLVLTDLIENFEQQRVKKGWLRWAMRTFGADGSLPYDVRLTFLPKMKTMRRQVGRMLQWPVARVTMAHGKPYTENAPAELRRAFKWAMPK